MHYFSKKQCKNRKVGNKVGDKVEKYLTVDEYIESGKIKVIKFDRIIRIPESQFKEKE